MTTFLLTFNPAKSSSIDHGAPVKESGAVESWWSTGPRASGVMEGDRIFLLQQGAGARSLLASGRATSEVEQYDHWDPARSGTANYVRIDWDHILDESEVLPLAELQITAPKTHWKPQGSGTLVDEADAAAVEARWLQHLRELGKSAPPREPKGWLLLAAGDSRAFAGNDGYADDTATSYRWDSKVPNAQGPDVGDFIIVWDSTGSLGASVIEDIEVGSAPKLIRRCPGCSQARIKARSVKTPLYRCQDCGLEFDEADEHWEEVTTFSTQHELGWVDLEGRLTAGQVRKLSVHQGSQHAIRQMDLAVARVAVPELSSEATGPTGRAHRRVNGGFTQRITKVRTGQGAFRRQLLARYGAVCALSGPAPEPSLEAAHLYSYARIGKHEDDGGLLLRRDLHALFDRGLIAIDPSARTIVVGDDLKAFPGLAALSGAELHVTLSRRQLKWLKERWEEHGFNEV